jgi:hypothetical protein
MSFYKEVSPAKVYQHSRATGSENGATAGGVVKGASGAGAAPGAGVVGGCTPP